MALIIPDQATIRRMCLWVGATKPEWIQILPISKQVPSEKVQLHEWATDNKVCIRFWRYDNDEVPLTEDSWFPDEAIEECE